MCRESYQTSWNDYNMLATGFKSACSIAREDFGWICKGEKLADFDQQACRPLYPMVLNMAEFGIKCAGKHSKLPEMPPSCLQMEL